MPHQRSQGTVRRQSTPFPGPPRSIGGYFHGCLGGDVPLPITGPTWRVMRLSRNRNWGNPQLIRFIERFAENAKKDGWDGLLVGDISQPRGGPMLSERKSHQTSSRFRKRISHLSSFSSAGGPRERTESSTAKNA
jgi:murein endopeptidase